MLHTVHSGENPTRKKPYFLKVFIVLLWIFGLIVGVFFARNSTESFRSLMLGAELQPMSIVGILLVSFLPFMISAIAAYCKLQFLFLPIAFFKAFLFSYSAYGIILAFESAGWLMRWILMFSDSCISPMFIFFILSNTTGEFHTFRHRFIVSAVYTAIICCIDCYLVFPFATTLI